MHRFSLTLKMFLSIKFLNKCINFFLAPNILGSSECGPWDQKVGDHCSRPSCQPTGMSD